MAGYFALAHLSQICADVEAFWPQTLHGACSSHTAMALPVARAMTFLVADESQNSHLFVAVPIFIISSVVFRR